MSEQDEIEKRALTSGLLAKKAHGPRQKRAMTKTRKLKKHLDAHNAAEHPRRQRKRKALAKAAEPDRPKQRRGRGSRRPFTLDQLMIIRTDGDKWYTFAQLVKLLPETNYPGVSATVRMSLKVRGLLERMAIVDDPITPWDESEDKTERWNLVKRPRYRYRIGSQIDTERARLRLRWLAHTETPAGGEKTSQ